MSDVGLQETGREGGEEGGAAGSGACLFFPYP